MLVPKHKFHLKTKTVHWNNRESNSFNNILSKDKFREAIQTRKV